MSVFPFGRTTVSIRPMGLPLFAGSTVIVTRSPGLKESLLHPAGIMLMGAWVSVIQCATSPFSPFTSYIKRQWGLAHHHSVTVPFIVSLFDASYAAFPWCASSGAEPIKRAIAKLRVSENLIFIEAP